MKRKRQTTESSETQATIASPDTDVESFGPWLRQQREVRGIDRREVADASKISVRYIDALESNHFEILPAEVFTKGFLRQYAAYVGLDPEDVVNYYLAALQAHREQLEPDLEMPSRPRSSGRTNFKWLLAALVLAAVLLAVVWLIFRASMPANPWSSPADGASTTAVARPDPDPPPPIAEPASEVGTEDTPESTDEASLAAAADPDGSASAVSPASDSDPAADRPASGPPLEVVVDFAGDCWVEAVLDGNRRLAEMRVQGESLRLDAQSTIDLKLGNGRVVEVQLNGRPYAFEVPQGSSVVALRFDASALPALDSGSRPQ